MSRSETAIETYVDALVDIAMMLDRHHEARAAFESAFLVRIIRDGFLQTISEQDQERILSHQQRGEEFLLWKGTTQDSRMNWNSIGWIFPFVSLEEMERAYEFITRLRLSQKRWAVAHHFIFSCRLRFQEDAIDVPTNLIKIRAMGEACQSAMQTLEFTPPNLRYVTKAMLDRLPMSHYLRTRIQVKLVIGEKLAPYIHTSPRRNNA